MCGAAERWEPAVALPQRAGSSAAAAGPGAAHMLLPRVQRRRGASARSPLAAPAPSPAKLNCFLQGEKKNHLGNRWKRR